MHRGEGWRLSHELKVVVEDMDSVCSYAALALAMQTCDRVVRDGSWYARLHEVSHEDGSKTALLVERIIQRFGKKTRVRGGKLFRAAPNTRPMFRSAPNVRPTKRRTLGVCTVRYVRTDHPRHNPVVKELDRSAMR